jgi:hypothetical protein
VVLAVGCSKWSSSKAADDINTAGVPLGYIEDVGEPRTKLGIIFSIRGEINAT